MAIELHSENFQSWEKFDITLEGLTVLVGPSNVGKSATFRALKGLVRNTLNAAQVRVGSDGIKIEAVIDGRRITALRPKKGSVSYNVDGEDYLKLDGAVPEQVSDLGMGELVIGKVKLDPVFAKQFDSQFVLEMTDGPLNTVLGAFSSTERLEAGKRTANQRISEKNAEARVLAKDMRAVEERRARLEVLVSQAAAIQAAIDTTEAEMRHREQTLEQLNALIFHTIRLNQLRTVLKGIQVPDTAPVAHDIQVLGALGQASVVKRQHQRTLGALDRLRIPEIEQAHRLYERMVYSGQAAAAHVALTKTTAATEKIVSVIEVWTGVVSLYKRGKAVEEAEQALIAYTSSRAKEYIERLDAQNMQIDVTIREANQLSTSIKTLGTLAVNRTLLDAHRAELRSVEQQTEQALAQLDEITAAFQEQAIAAAKAKVKLCPKCGEPIE